MSLLLHVLSSISLGQPVRLHSISRSQTQTPDPLRLLSTEPSKQLHSRHFALMKQRENLVEDGENSDVENEGREGVDTLHYEASEEETISDDEVTKL